MITFEIGKVVKCMTEQEYDNGDWSARMMVAQAAASDRMQDVFVFKPWVVPIMYSGPGPGASCNPPGPGTRWPVKSPLGTVNFYV